MVICLFRMPPDGMDFSFQGYEDLPSTPSQTSGEIGAPKPRKKWDRFNGMSVEDVKQRTLPDHLAPNLDIIIVRTPHSHSLFTRLMCYSQVRQGGFLFLGWH